MAVSRESLTQTINEMKRWKGDSKKDRYEQIVLKQRDTVSVRKTDKKWRNTERESDKKKKVCVCVERQRERTNTDRETQREVIAHTAVVSESGMILNRGA